MHEIPSKSLTKVNLKVIITQIHLKGQNPAKSNVPQKISITFERDEIDEKFQPISNYTNLRSGNRWWRSCCCIGRPLAAELAYPLLQSIRKTLINSSVSDVGRQWSWPAKIWDAELELETPPYIRLFIKKRILVYVKKLTSSTFSCTGDVTCDHCRTSKIKWGIARCFAIDDRGWMMGILYTRIHILWLSGILVNSY